MSAANVVAKARVEALFARVQALPRDHFDGRGNVLAHLFGALDGMASGFSRCSLDSMLDAVERAVACAEASAARRVVV